MEHPSFAADSLKQKKSGEEGPLPDFFNRCVYFPHASGYSVEMTNLLQIDCPYCGTRTSWYDNPSRPFCSERCRLIDLGRWDSEEYSVPGEKTDEQPDNTDETSF